jgi:hypothetical protein
MHLKKNQQRSDVQHVVLYVSLLIFLLHITLSFEIKIKSAVLIKHEPIEGINDGQNRFWKKINQ